MKILHLSPTYFARDSVIGGGERYALELARALSESHDVRFLSFSDSPSDRYEGKLNIRLLKKDLFTIFRIFKEVLWADKIHCHQVYRLENDIAIISAKLLGKKVFISDLGGWGRYSLCYHYPLLRHTNGLLLISNYSKKLWEAPDKKNRSSHVDVIYGGVDTTRFVPGIQNEHKHVLFVGRLVSHKGIDYLIDAVDRTTSLRLIGQAYDQEYFSLLKKKAGSKQVSFEDSIDDRALVEAYQTALVTVQASVYEDTYGRHTDVPELLGLSALESMACGTPVIVSNVASLPEIVEDGVTGFVVPPNNPEAIREKIQFLKDNPEKVIEMGKRARESVMNQFTWKKVAAHCAEIYQASNGKQKV